MIPVRLSLRNFMSYGEEVQPLDFSGIRLACLCGDNGNGKSALLDAVTWALWGEARAPADELVRLGSDEMRVVFDFELGGNLYRVIRGRSRRSSGNVWELCIADSSGEFKPITGHGIRDTGRQIQRILHMNYKTFINSAYIQQGKADEFTKQTVADRKKILGDILDLERYDRLEQKAKERRNEAELLAAELGGEIGRIEAELALEDEYKTRLDQSRAERDALEADIRRLEGEQHGLQARQAELQAMERRIQELRTQAANLRSEMEGLVARGAEQERRVERDRAILRDRELILSGQQRLKDTRERLIRYDHTLEEVRRLELEKSGLEQKILGERHRIELERQSAAKELAELRTKLAEAEKLKAHTSTLREQVEELEKLEARRAQVQDEFSQNANLYGELKSRYELLLKAEEDLKEKLQLISAPGAACPLCKSELSIEKHRSLIQGYEKQVEEAKREIQDLRQQGAAAKRKRDSAQREMDAISAEIQAGLDVRKRLAQAEQLLFQVEESARHEPDLLQRFESLKARLDSDDFARELRDQVKDIQARIDGLEYDVGEHKKLKQELEKLQEFETLAVSLKHAEESLPSDESGLKAIESLIEARRKSISEAEEEAVRLGGAIEDLTAVNEELRKVNQSIQSLREADREVTGRIATLEHSLARCKSLREQVRDKRKELEKAKKDKAVYSELVSAFGKKGVQALIIENAIPEIQEEANRLLARLTDNAMQISFETVRDKKSGPRGQTAETLDIKVSDEMGTRSYELYSGGEAFRINFALRIAISKLLARRAGAQLQTLVVDEGFGTQDGKGREKLVEAINSIQDDFEKILVITHIDELKDAFPTRIEITKDSQGSQISVN